MSKKYTKEELERMINSNKWRDRLEVAKQGYGLDKLINDSSPFVRSEVANKGYGLDTLINDESEYVIEYAYQLYQIVNSYQINGV